mmetsp:Transcript_6851/g.13947  ORF Transcript_6851/g.13947 Transcript_6851/m.13947 type:complete len:219 (-) Transcript_6851:115-771(-)
MSDFQNKNGLPHSELSDPKVQRIIEEDLDQALMLNGKGNGWETICFDGLDDLSVGTFRPDTPLLTTSFDEEDEIPIGHTIENEPSLPGQDSWAPQELDTMVTSCVLTTNDVVLGRGELANTHPGNKKYRAKRDMLKRAYNAAKRSQRRLVAIQLMTYVRDAGGLFLKMDEQGMWQEVPEKVAIDKCAHALREKKTRRVRPLQTPFRPLQVPFVSLGRG